MTMQSFRGILIYCRSGNKSGTWSLIHLSVRSCTLPGPVNLSTLHTVCMARSFYSVDSARYLGVDIASDLNFNQHVNRVSANASKTLGYLKRNISTKHPGIREAAYKTIIRPQLEYASTVWSPLH